MKVVRRAVRLCSVLLVAVVMTLQLSVAGATGDPARAGKAATAEVAALPPGSECSPQLYRGKHTGTTFCYVRSGAWTYYQAYVTQYDGYDCGGQSMTTSTIRIQILARKGETGVHIGGVWVVYNDGPRRFGTLQFTAFDGNEGTHNGAWNYNGGFSKDIADLYNRDDIIRYNLNPASFVGLAWGSNSSARFEGHWRVANNPYPYLSAGSCGFHPMIVLFKP